MKNKNAIFIIIGLILGIIGGFVAPEAMKELSFIGNIYINLLKFIIMPVIITSIIVTAYNSKKLKNKIVMKTIVLFVVMFVITFLITSIIVHFINFENDISFEAKEWDGEISEIKISDVIINLFPSNIVVIFQNNAIFAGILFAMFFGISATKINDSENVINGIETIRNVFFKMTEYIMKLTPIAVFSLIGVTVANYGEAVIGIGMKYILVAYLCSIICLFFVMILPVWLIAKVNPITYMKNLSKIWVMTFTTCSSVATLPTTIKTCNEKFGIENRITDIVVPLGCTIHMCGGAVSFALLGIFCSQIFSITITPLVFVKMLITATLINMAAPGIPNGGIVIGATYLSILGIPLEFIGIYSGIYKLLDMIYTTLNVTGDVSANILINNGEKG